VARYGQFCPVAAAAEVLTERWTLLVIREMLGGSRRFNDIHRGVPLMSSSLLAQRLRKLQRVGVVERARRTDAPGHEYRLTQAGEELGPVLWEIGLWGRRWAQPDVGRDEPDVGLLMWWLHRAVPIHALPDERVVVRFHYSAAPAETRSWWLVLARPEVDLCLTDPGFGDDLVVRSDPTTVTAVFMGDLAIGDALRERRLRLEGPEHLVRAFPSWMGLGPFASVRPAGPRR
jgi:DNA-binding HxlR family transcriptional regulator